MTKGTLPTLFHKGRKGAMYQWSVWTEGADICTEYGQVDGQLQVSRKAASAKNVGQSNATTPTEQAEREARAMHKHKMDRKYSPTPEEAQEELFLPMLAHDHEKKAKYVRFPLTVQPKMDGLRCMAFWDGDQVRLQSRQGKDLCCRHIKDTLESWMPKDTVLDGELYQHGVGFQTITKLVKKERPESVGVEYHVYDCPIFRGEEGKTWQDRMTSLAELMNLQVQIQPTGSGSKIVFVDSRTAKDWNDIRLLHASFMQDGFEGTILRMQDGLYEFGYRSPALLKYKDFKDDEFVISGYREGEGKYAGCIVWECKTASGQEFRVVPRGTLEEKRDWYQNARSYVGRYLKVRYQELTDDGIPRFPVGVGIRDMTLDS